MNNETKEKLASEVQKWPLLYDKSDKNYKNRVLVDQAWAKVAENMGIEGLFLLIKPCAVQHDGGGPTSISTTRPEKKRQSKTLTK